MTIHTLPPAATPHLESRQQQRSVLRGRRRVEPIFYVFLVPALLLFTVVIVIPAVIGIFYSFTDYVGYGQWHFLGLQNYATLFTDPSIIGSYGFTLGFAVVTVIVAQVIALAFAVGLSRTIRFAGPLRTIFVIPMVVSGIVVAYVFNFLFSNSLPALATTLGFGPLEQSILGNPDLAWLSIVIVSAWQTIPGALLVYTAGLTSIPGDLYEASSIDGASSWKQFRSITLPLISGFILINTVLGVKGYLGAYDVIVGLTGGGPGTATRSVAMTIFSGFTGGDYAYQMANATIFFIVTVIISIIQLGVTRGRPVSL
ncbi:carbohydrate ABC transporter permease [Cryobacterium soli]|uniref:carbohydrate ABC transporter permease n=1 Tax=Cryobacterium soli TaxID=2220095 RepID=UPI000E71D3A3|nr:sugar ABC transporter permease [Cryobacterium soli]